jgi:hypothetical protein
MEFGYYFKPPEYPQAPGSPCLEINIYEIPTLQHDDPEQVILKVVSNERFPEALAVTHPWSQENDAYRVCVGHVNLNDRKGKIVNAFTLGGKLIIQRYDDKTHCELESQAPILQTGKMFEIPSLLADEIEIIIAQRAATWLPDLETHQKRLASMDPFTLYTSCLKKLENKYQTHEHQELTRVIKFRIFISNEISELQKMDRWPKHIPDIEDLI